MTKEHARDLLQAYSTTWDAIIPGMTPVQLGERMRRSSASQVPIVVKVAHFKFMCEQAMKMLDEGLIDKPMRWLGFIQGVLWSMEYYSLESIIEHSTPSKDENESDKA